MGFWLNTDTGISPAEEMEMSITYLPRKTRRALNPPTRFECNRNYLIQPNYQRAYDHSWWSRSVGKTMRRGDRLWDESCWDFKESQKSRLRRRAHVWWRRGHRVRRAQWATQTYSLRCGGEWLYMPFVKYFLMGWHWLMQKRHERAFAAI